MRTMLTCPADLRSPSEMSDSPQNCYDLSEDHRVVSVDRLEGRVVRHQPDLGLGLLERLHGRLAVDHGSDDVTVLRGLLLPDDHPVAVADGDVDHRLTLDLEHE